MGLCASNGSIDFSKANILIGGYEQVIQIPKEEKNTINSFIVYAATATAFWRFRQFNIIAPTPSHRDTYLDMKNIADSILFLR